MHGIARPSFRDPPTAVITSSTGSRHRLTRVPSVGARRGRAPICTDRTGEGGRWAARGAVARLAGDHVLTGLAKERGWSDRRARDEPAKSIPGRATRAGEARCGGREAHHPRAMTPRRVPRSDANARSGHAFLLPRVARVSTCLMA